MEFEIGRRKYKRNPLTLNINNFIHVVVLGDSGCGKTVTLKSIIEGFIVSGIPVIAVDPKGDIVSLLQKKGLRREHDRYQYTQFWKGTDFRIFTPGIKHGFPVSLNPFIPGYTKMNDYDFSLYVDSVIAILSSLCNIIQESKMSQRFVNVLYNVISNRKVEFRDINHLIDKMPGGKVRDIFFDLNQGSRKRYLNVGKPLHMSTFLGNAHGRIPLNVISLSSLALPEDKIKFVKVLSEMIYRYCLINQVEGKQLLYTIDEVSPFIPPVRKPGSKEILQRLMTEGRGLGLVCCLCSNKMADVDYNVLEQANMWFVGRMKTKQNIDRIKTAFSKVNKKFIEGADILATLKETEMMLYCADLGESIQRIHRMKELFSLHTPIAFNTLPQLIENARSTPRSRKIKKIDNIRTMIESMSEQIVKVNMKKEEDIDGDFICPECFSFWDQAYCKKCRIILYG